MGQKKVTCVLGELQVRDVDKTPIRKKNPRTGTAEYISAVRQYVWTEQTPSLACFRVIETIARGIEGIKAVVRNVESYGPYSDCSIILVLREDVDPTSTGKHFITSMAATLNNMSTDEQASMLNNPDLVAAAVAIHSQTRNTDD